MNLDMTSPWKILIVDDEEDIHDVTEMALKRLIFEERPLTFISAYSAKEAKIKLREHSDIAVILLDVVMESDTAGLDLIHYIRDDNKNDEIRIVLRTGNPGLAPEENITLTYDINDYRGKTELTAQSLRTVIITALRSYKAIATIKLLNHEIDSTQRELIYTLGEIAESRGTDTSRHVERVAVISAFLGEKLGLTKLEQDQLLLASSMHDIGKMAIHDTILNKPDKLSFEEFEQMKRHCEYGYEILRNSSRSLLKTASIIAYEHHENFDGSGYPRGLKGLDIHLYSRIVALVDVFDALATKRVYKEVWPQNEILDFIKSQRGIKFDPYIVDIFFNFLDELYQRLHKEDLIEH